MQRSKEEKSPEALAERIRMIREIKGNKESDYMRQSDRNVTGYDGY